MKKQEIIVAQAQEEQSYKKSEQSQSLCSYIKVTAFI